MLCQEGSLKTFLPLGSHQTLCPQVSLGCPWEPVGCAWAGDWTACLQDSPGKGWRPEQHRHLLLTVPKPREAYRKLTRISFFSAPTEFLEKGVGPDVLSSSGITSHCHVLAEIDGGEYALPTDGTRSTAGGSAGSRMEAFWRKTDFPPVGGGCLS